MSAHSSGSQFSARALLAAAVSCSTLAYAAAPARAWCLSTVDKYGATSCDNPNLPTQHWEKRCTAYALHVSGSRSIPDMEKLREVFERAFEPWSNITCGGVPLRFEAHQLDALAQCDQAVSGLGKKPSASTIFFVQSGWDAAYEGFPSDSTLALTFNHYNTKTGRILEADMAINEEARYHNYTICPESGCTKSTDMDLLSVLTHEAGHYFGLAHSKVADSTMFFRIGSGTTSVRSLERDDLSGICARYAPHTLPETWSECDDSNPWGLSLECPKAQTAGSASRAKDDRSVQGAATGCDCGGTATLEGGGQGGAAAWGAVVLPLAFVRRRARRRQGANSNLS